LPQVPPKLYNEAAMSEKWTVVD